MSLTYFFKYIFVFFNRSPISDVPTMNLRCLGKIYRSSIHFCPDVHREKGPLFTSRMKRKGRKVRGGGSGWDEREGRYGAVCNHALSGGSYQPLRVAKGARGVRSLRGKPFALESIRGEPPHQYSRAAICSRSLTPSPLGRGGGGEGGLGQSENRRPAPTGHHVARLMVIKRERGTSFQTSGCPTVRGIISKWRIIRRRWHTE